MQIAADQHLLKDLNRMAIVRQLSAWPGQSRAALAESRQLAKSTVSALVKELIAESWLLEREVVATGELGRRPTPRFVDPGRPRPSHPTPDCRQPPGRGRLISAVTS